MYAEDLAWVIRGLKESELEGIPDEVLELYLEILGNPDPMLNSDLAVFEVDRLKHIIEEHIEVWRTEIRCEMCDRKGLANMKDGRYFCGSGPRCCP